MINVSKNISEVEIDDMLKEADLDMNKFINYEELIRLLFTK